MEPKDYSTIRSILKQEQGDTKPIREYLDRERITYEIYQEERVIKQALEILIKNQGKKERYQSNEIYGGNPIYFFYTLNRRNFTKPDKLNITYTILLYGYDN